MLVKRKFDVNFVRIIDDRLLLRQNNMQMIQRKRMLVTKRFQIQYLMPLDIHGIFYATSHGMFSESETEFSPTTNG